jgi:hypothetical protein
MTKMFWFVPILLVIPVVNVISDPASIFRANEYSREVATILLTGKSAAHADRSDLRLTAKHYITRLQEAKSTVVIGSSRSMNIRQEFVGAESFFNASISAAGLEDLISITELFFERGLPPTEIIFELAPWYLNARNRYSRWNELREEYVAGNRRFDLRDRRALWYQYTWNVPDRLIALFSPKYFQKSLAALLKRPGRNAEPFISPTDLDEAAYVIRRRDGSVSYSQSARDVSVAQVNQLANRYANAASAPYFEDYTELNPNLKAVFRRFITALKINDVRAVFFLAPLHPYVYKKLSGTSKYKVFEEVESFYRQIAAEQRIPVVGSYNPLDFGCGEEEFYDAIHPKELCVERIFQRYVNSKLASTTTTGAER